MDTDCAVRVHVALCKVNPKPFETTPQLKIGEKNQLQTIRPVANTDMSNETTLWPQCHAYQ
jgi:hypothetical protein